MLFVRAFLMASSSISPIFWQITNIWASLPVPLAGAHNRLELSAVLLLLLVPVFLVSLRHGLWAGLTATAVGATLSIFLLWSNLGTPEWSHIPPSISLPVFVALGMMMSLTGSVAVQARDRSVCLSLDLDRERSMRLDLESQVRAWQERCESLAVASDKTLLDCPSIQTVAIQFGGAAGIPDQSERLYRAIGESIDHGVWVCDEEGGNVYVSDSFLRLVGLSQDQCSGYGWMSALHPDDIGWTRSLWQRSVHEGQPWEVQHRLRGIDGDWHHVLTRGVPVRDERGGIFAWAGINMDITRLKHVEDELRETGRRKDEFLATLAHELRNPLTPIRTALQLLRLAGDKAEIREQSCTMMDRQIRHLVRLIDDLTDVSRISRGRLSLRKELVDVAAIVRSALETSQPLIEAGGQNLHVQLPEVPTLLNADTVRLAQVISNLVNNAAKYTDRGGDIWLDVESTEDGIEIRVRDNGVGIPPDQLSLVFEMFTRMDHRLERAKDGLGIGLMLAKRLVELHDGVISAHSEGPGKGCDFVIRLPVISSSESMQKLSCVVTDASRPDR